MFRMFNSMLIYTELQQAASELLLSWMLSLMLIITIIVISCCLNSYTRAFVKISVLWSIKAQPTPLNFKLPRKIIHKCKIFPLAPFNPTNYFMNLFCVALRNHFQRKLLLSKKKWQCWVN